ncbi:phage integrase family protein with SAM-like domain [Azospirillum brasilense]|uniref:Core-binding (CB) domain-containing protein n=1 Tax=Azospirillum baldaniorum TaxID=1064539 RepID=A0A9P1NN31_9PROT|nr:phage integrase family protein with SAM-like domain [Azospirillum brasilense]CCC99290.1 protein of unknown function [Azospirillum baldaniorum]
MLRYATYPTAPMTLDEACVAFLSHCRVKNLSPHSIRAYAIDLREFERFAGAATLVTAVDRHLLRRYLAHLMDTRKLKETSVRRRIACLKVMFRWLELDEVIETSPFHRLDARVRLPRRLPRSLTNDEARRLQSAAAARAGITGRLTAAKVERAARRASLDDLTALLAVEGHLPLPTHGRYPPTRPWPPSGRSGCRASCADRRPAARPPSAHPTSAHGRSR